MTRRRLILLVVCLLVTGGLSADTLYRKNGKVIRNVKIVGQTRMQVRYKKKDDDKVLYIAKSQLKRITYGAVDDDEEERRKRAEARKKRETEARKRAAERRRKAAAERRRRAAAAAQKKLKGAIRRDIVLPGWGQWHLGQRGKGAAFAGAFLATAGYAFSSSQQLEAATANYLDPTPFVIFQSSNNGLILGNLVYGQRAAEVRTAAGQLNQSILLLTLLWAGAFLDLSFYEGSVAAPARSTRGGSRSRTRSPSKGGGPSKGKPLPSDRRRGTTFGGSEKQSMRAPGRVDMRAGIYALPPLSADPKDRGSLGVVVQFRF